jgi:hypothetical protein
MSRSLEVIHQQLQCAVEGLVSSDGWKAMLEVASRFQCGTLMTDAAGPTVVKVR